MSTKPKPAKRKARPEPIARKAAPDRQRTTKKTQLIALLRQKGGQDVTALGRALGWQAHTVRAALTGLRHAGYTVDRSAGADGVGRYSIAGGAA